MQLYSLRRASTNVYCALIIDYFQLITTLFLETRWLILSKCVTYFMENACAANLCNKNKQKRKKNQIGIFDTIFKFLSNRRHLA